MISGKTKRRNRATFHPFHERFTREGASIGQRMRCSPVAVRTNRPYCVDLWLRFVRGPRVLHMRLQHPIQHSITCNHKQPKEHIRHVHIPFLVLSYHIAHAEIFPEPSDLRHQVAAHAERQYLRSKRPNRKSGMSSELPIPKHNALLASCLACRHTQ